MLCCLLRTSGVCSLAAITGQVVKGASIAVTLTGVPYVAGCLVPSLLVGGFTFAADIGSVERANTALAGAMVLGFCVLVASTLRSALSGPSGLALGAAAMAARLRVANWQPLLPSLAGAARGETWTLPVLLNLLCFGQSVLPCSPAPLRPWSGQMAHGCRIGAPRPAGLERCSPAPLRPPDRWPTAAGLERCGLKDWSAAGCRLSAPRVAGLRAPRPVGCRIEIELPTVAGAHCGGQARRRPLA